MTDFQGVDLKTISVDAKAEERFWSKVTKAADCWEWIASKNGDGYGQFYMSGKMYRSHRVSYSIKNWPIPTGMEIDHICHNRGCVRPSHLRLATRKQNAENVEGAQVNSQSGVRGVHWLEDRKQWRAQVQHFNRLVYVGAYDRLEDAERAVTAKRRELFTHA